MLMSSAHCLLFSKRVMAHASAHLSQDTQYTAVSLMQHGVVARCVVYCIDVFGVGGIDDFGVRALLCVCYCVCVLFIGGVRPSDHHPDEPNQHRRGRGVQRDEEGLGVVAPAAVAVVQRIEERRSVSERTATPRAGVAQRAEVDADTIVKVLASDGHRAVAVITAGEGGGW